MSRPKSYRNATEANLVKDLDDLMAFEQFREEIHPDIRKDLKKGMSAEAITAKYAVYAAARTASMIMTSRDDKVVLAAAKDLRDRNEGRAKEKQEITHRMERLEEKDLNSLILSKLKAEHSNDKDEDEEATH